MALSDEDRTQGGFDRVLAKPCLHDGLLETIEACIAEREAVAAEAN